MWSVANRNLRQRGIGNTNPIKFARCIQELEKIYDVRNGSAGKRSLDGNNFPPKTQSDLAEQFGVSEKQLRNYKNLLTLVPELQDSIEQGILSPTVGYKVLAKLSKEQQDREYQRIRNNFIRLENR
ncbi:hypothetical protein SDC9_182294 [bioreactor metagenome]|uniref:ParB/Spo0J HTH domain-containing protein n=1 Tax=bioreactor metagenome TaxID=1076179 RepID=A0A645H7Z0_9ZZZZ